METRTRRRVGIASIGTAAVIAALVLAPQAGTAEPLVGEKGIAQAVAAGRGAAYLEVDGITTATSVPAQPDHTGDIALSSMSWSASNSSGFSTGGGGGAGKVAFTDFTLLKSLDSTTPLLLAPVATGRHLSAARIYLVRTDKNGTQLEALEYDLTDVLITGDAESSENGGSETVKLAAQKIVVTYFQGVTAVNTFGWDVAKNSKV